MRISDWSSDVCSSDLKLVLLDALQQGLHAGRVQLDQVLEGEHQRLDALGGIAAALLQRGEEARLGVAVEAVEDFRHHFMAVATVGARQVRQDRKSTRLNSSH